MVALSGTGQHHGVLRIISACARATGAAVGAAEFAGALSAGHAYCVGHVSQFVAGLGHEFGVAVHPVEREGELRALSAGARFRIATLAPWHGRVSFDGVVTKKSTKPTPRNPGEHQRLRTCREDSGARPPRRSSTPSHDICNGFQARNTSWSKVRRAFRIE